MRRVFATALLMLASFAPLRVCAQEPQEPCRHRTIVVSVVDEHGVAVAGLTAANFKIELRGKPVAVESAGPMKKAARAVVLLDASGSMSDKSEWGLARGLAVEFLSDAPKEANVATLIFARSVQKEIGFGVDRNTAIAELRAAGPATGRTAFFDAIIRAVQLLDPPQPGDAIYAITDGGDNASHAHNSQAAKAIQQNGIRFFAAAFADPLGGRPTPEEQEGPENLEDFVNHSGGSWFLFPSGGFHLTNKERAHLSVELLALQQEIWHGYALELTLPEPVAKETGWKMSLTGVDRKMLEKWRTAFPKKLAGCGVP